MVQLVVNPVNAVPMISDIVRFAMRKATGQKAWKVFSTPLLDDLETGIRKLGKDEVTAGDYLQATASVLEAVSALPIKTYLRFYDYVVGTQKEKGSKKK